MSKLSLSDWLARLEALHPKEIDLGLQRIKIVAGRLDISHIASKVITVAGTNGKGSTVQLLSKILSASNYRVGCYTSPHLLYYNERITISELPATDDDLCRAFELIENARESISLTYFEFGTLAAFILFAEAELDVAILEVGLGGRLDAVNIIDPDVAILTTVALDHQDWLGSTREEIGLEKAGIFRPNTPAICGDPNIPKSVIEYADKISADLLCINRDFGYEVTQKQNEEKVSNFWGQKNNSSLQNTQNTYGYKNSPIPLLPIMNFATAVQALNKLDLSISEQAIVLATAQGLPGRYQRINRGYTLILDVAHNPQAADYLYLKLSGEIVTGKIHALVGMLADKDSDKILSTFAPIIDSWAVAGLNTSRAMATDALEQKLLSCTEKPIQMFKTVETALSFLDKELDNADILVVFGSFYTVTAALEWLQIEV